MAEVTSPRARRSAATPGGVQSGDRAPHPAANLRDRNEIGHAAAIASPPPGRPVRQPGFTAAVLRPRGSAFTRVNSRCHAGNSACAARIR